MVVTPACKKGCKVGMHALAMHDVGCNFACGSCTYKTFILNNGDRYSEAVTVSNYEVVYNIVLANVIIYDDDDHGKEIYEFNFIRGEKTYKELKQFIDKFMKLQCIS